MSRLRKYAHSVASGYIFMAANTAYTLVSVPLALRYLSKAEFGLWALTSQIALYLGLVDFGMSAAGMRILVDHKDQRDQTNYGSVIQTGLLVNFVQAILILAGAVGTAFLMEDALDVPAELVTAFRWLVFWQAVLMAVGTLARTAMMVLTAHQRYDVVNHSQTLLWGVSLGILWVGFASGAGVYSLVWAQGISQVLGALIAVGACLRLQLLPVSGQWGRPSWRWFRELFAYGRDMFLYSVGHLLIGFSQTILITRVAGLDTAAVWSVCTRTFALITQMVYRLFDYACAALAEMIVRGERDRLLQRFRSMMVLSGTLSVVAGLAFAVGNQPFVTWWTGGKIGWTSENDWLLAAWLFVLVQVRGHTGLVGLTKEFRFMRYLYFCEGLFFVTAGFVGLRQGGIAAMLGISLLGSLAISFPYSIRRTAEYFGLPWKTVAVAWAVPSLRLLLVLGPAALGLGWLSRAWPPFAGFVFCAGAVVSLGAGMGLRWGLDHATRSEISARLPARFGRLRDWIARP